MNKQIPERIAIVCYGALGDMILHYYRENSIFGQIKHYKKQHPNAQFKVICCSSNLQAHELFKENPNICEVHHVPHALQGRGSRKRDEQIAKSVAGWKRFGSGSKLPGAKYRKPQMYLNSEDSALVRSIQKEGRYILIHPFTSFTTKILEEEYAYIIDAIIDELGYKVVVVGGTYYKSFQEAEIQHKEAFGYRRDGLFNLVNSANVRVAVKLAKNAYGYLGTWSAFYCASFLCPASPMVFCTADKASTIDLINKRRFGKAKYRKIVVPALHRHLEEENPAEIEKRILESREGIKKNIMNHLGENK
jgi:ADP-heptose:LPS heptosyltransferase